MKLAITTFLLVLVCLDGSSQTRINVFTGLSVSRHNISDPENTSVRVYDSWAEKVDSRSISGLELGVELENRISRSFLISTGLRYIQAGQEESLINREPSGPLYVSAKYQDRINYIRIPLEIAYYREYGGIEFSFSTGVYFGFGVGGSTTFERMSYCYKGDCSHPFGSDYLKAEGKLYFKDELNSSDEFNNTNIAIKRGDFGLNLGFAMHYSRFGFYLDYQMGTSNIHPDDVGLDEQHSFNRREKMNRTLSVGIKYTIFNFQGKE